MTDATLRRQSALLRLSTGIAAAQDEVEVCQAVVDGLHDEALGYNFLGVLLLDPDNGDRVMQANVGWDQEHEGFRLRPGESRRAVRIEDTGLGRQDRTLAVLGDGASLEP